MNPIAVITARAGSKRIPFKNMLPLGGVPLAEHSIRQALHAGLFTIVTSDIDALLASAAKAGALAVRRPSDFANGDRHLESIKHAVESCVAIDPSKRGAPVVLLQPTSPFRNGDIIERCLKAHAENPNKVVFSGRTIHYAEPSGRPIQLTVWDGCVAVYPHDGIAPQEDAIVVENEHGNMLQVDTEEDYIQACIQHWRMTGCPVPLGGESGKSAIEELKRVVGKQIVTLVARPNGRPLEQGRPVAWINHCHGWDGGRADVLFLVAAKNLVKVGINKELAEVASKVSLVVVRNFGEAEWVLSNLKTNGKIVVAEESMMQVSTGAFASIALKMAGAYCERVGFQRGVSRIPYCVYGYPQPRVSEELAMLEVSGRELK